MFKARKKLSLVHVKSLEPYPRHEGYFARHQIWIVKDIFSWCEQICRCLQNCSDLLKKSLTEYATTIYLTIFLFGKNISISLIIVLPSSFSQESSYFLTITFSNIFEEETLMLYQEDTNQRICAEFSHQYDFVGMMQSNISTTIKFQ